ncbi:MAG: NERD domain-containing protein [Pseudomonadota bacterium]
MATIHSQPIEGQDEPSELKAFEALKALTDDWHIFYSVAWVGVRGKRVGDGEADFVIVHPNYGAIIIEVKGGGISIEAGQWRSTGRSGSHSIKDPFRQATKSKTALHKWFDKEIGLRLLTGHCVLFPDFSDIGALGPHAPCEITITPRDYADINAKMIGVAHKWGLVANLSAKQIRVISQALAPKVSARRTLADEALDAQRNIIELTQEQIRAFAGLRRNRRAVIFGGAGTGKTILAAEKAAEFEAQGGDVLLVCYNSLLASRLRKDPRLSRTKVTTFHALCMEELRHAGRQPPNKPDLDWWEDHAAEQLVDALAETGRAFDAIVVDEGQDFAQSWINALEIAGEHGDDTPFYVFADENQTLWPRNWEAPSNWFVYELSVNCRNTMEIAQRLEPIVPGSSTCRGARGPEAKWTELKRSDSASRVAIELVSDLLEEGFAPRELTVLCENSTTARELQSMSVGAEGFSNFEGPGITVETISRFKGLEAPAIVLVLEREAEMPDAQCYVGFSRAITVLRVVGSRERKRSVQWS